MFGRRKINLWESSIRKLRFHNAPRGQRLCARLVAPTANRPKTIREGSNREAERSGENIGST